MSVTDDAKLSDLERNDIYGKSCKARWLNLAIERRRHRTNEKEEWTAVKVAMAERSHVIVGYPAFLLEPGSFSRSRYAHSSRSYLSSIPDFRHLQSHPTYRSMDSIIFISVRRQDTPASFVETRTLLLECSYTSFCFQMRIFRIFFIRSERSVRWFLVKILVETVKHFAHEKGNNFEF